MLTIVTGQPGNGKTLWILARIEAMRAKEGRPVFYSGIDLAEEGPLWSTWQKLGDIAERVEPWRDPEDNTLKVRFTLPPGAIVVIDEAQRIYRVRPQGSKVPDHVAALETHRHLGLDLFFLSQHPTLLDMHCRKIAGYHVHVRRPAGLQKTNVYEWESVQSDPLSQVSRKLARESVWSFPTEVFGWYKSAEAHTHKRNLPWKKMLLAFAALVVVIGSASYTAYHIMTGAGVVDTLKQKGADSVEGDGVRKGVGSGPNPWDETYRAPRVSGYVRTAPMFDPLQKVVSQPKVAGCMMLQYGDGEIDCRCSTDQGNVIPMTVRECRTLVREGWYDETHKVESAKSENIRRLNARDNQRSEDSKESPAS